MQKTPKINNILEKEVNKGICDAVGCSQNASKEITVDAGKFGTMSLSVCKNCVSKFVTSKVSLGDEHRNVI